MSWLKPYLRTWYQAYPESIPPVRQLAHYMKPLQKAQPEERIVQELAAYLERTAPQYVSLHRFAALFGTWSKGNGHQKSTPQMCLHHPERPAVATVSRNPLCRECFEEP